MTEAQLIDFLRANLKLTVSNTPDPGDWHSRFTVCLMLNNQEISRVLLEPNDGQ